MADRSPHPLDRRTVARHFDRAAPSYDAAAVLQREVARRMLERLDYIRVAPGRVLDLGCGTGSDLAPLAARFPDARVIGLDRSATLLASAREEGSWLRRLARLGRPRNERPVCVADAAALPLADRSVSLLWSNFLLHWFAEPQAVLAEMHRVLEVGGLLMFACLGPDTLRELRDAFARASPGVHVHRFIDMHDLGDMLVGAGFGDPVMDMETITLTYESVRALALDLRANGATLAADVRARGLMGRHAWARMVDAYETLRSADRLPATFEVVYGHAWRPQPRVTDDGRAIIRFQPRGGASL